MGKETDKRWKGIVIDWEKIAAMDNSDYELKPLNQQQVAVLLALLQYQKWQTRWINLELTNDELLSYIGDIEYRLMLNEGGLSMTPEELKNAISEGIYKATNDVAKQIVSGRTFGFSVGEDGIVSDPTTDDPVELPEDDPSTIYDDTKAAKYGAAVAVAEGIEAVWDRIDFVYGATNGSPLVTEPDAQYIMKNLFYCDAALMDAAVSAYYIYRGTNPRFTYDPPASFPQFLYCKGINQETAVRWMLESSGLVLAKILVMNNFIKALTPEFFSYYSGIGSQAPSTAFAEASCEPSPSETLIVPTLVALNSQTNWKANHRLKVTVSGYFVDSASPQNTRDFWWNRTSAGVLTFQSGNTIQQGSPAPTKPTSNQVPYRNDHTYTFTLDTNSAGVLQLGNGSAGMTAPITTPTGGFTFIIEDLGEYLG